MMFVVPLVLAGCGGDGGTGPGGGGSPITFPLTIGNTWFYDASAETTSVATARVDTVRIAATQSVGGRTYYVLEDSGDDGPGTLIRQDGQDILVIPSFGGPGPGPGDPIQEWLGRALEASLPWKFADMDAASGTSWTLVDADTLVDLGGTVDTLQVSFAASSLGRTSVSVPAGTFTDVYQGQVLGTISFGDQVMQRTNQWLWLGHGVGMLKQRESNTERQDGSAITITETSELVSYSLNTPAHALRTDSPN